jgi:hypothetical protein
MDTIQTPENTMRMRLYIRQLPEATSEDFWAREVAVILYPWNLKRKYIILTVHAYYPVQKK